MVRILFLLLLSVSAFGQLRVMPGAVVSKPATGTPPGDDNIQDIDITVNPAQYIGTNVSITANANGATVTSWKWRILRRYKHTGGRIDTVLHRTSTSQNPTFSIDTAGFYDVQLIARNTIDKYSTYKYRLFEVFPPRFTEGEADLVINLTGASGVQYYEFQSADWSDKKIYIKGSNTGTSTGIELRGLHGSDEHPVRIQKSNDNTQVQLTKTGGTGNVFYFSQYGAGEGARYVVVNGFNLDGTPGIKLINGASSNITMRVVGKLTDINISGIEVQSNPLTIDGAAIAIVPTVASDCSKTTWACNNLVVYGCTLLAGEEGVYINESNQSSGYVGNNGFNPPSGTGIVVARNTITGAGRDGIQVGSAGGEVHNNSVSNFGQQHDSGGQESAFVANSGSFVNWFDNYATGGEMAFNCASGEYAYSPSTSDGRGAGHTTPQPTLFHNNIYKSGTYGAGGTDETHAIYIQNNPNSGAGNWSLYFYNNIIDTDNKACEMLLALGGYTSQNFTFVNNIIIKSGTAGDTEEFNVTGNGKATLQSGTKTIDDLVYNQGDNLSGLYFTDYSGGDFTITSLLSAAYSGTPSNLSSLATSAFAPFRDFLGFPVGIPGYYFGPYTNYNKRIITP